MKKNVVFSPLFLYNLALITHDATMSVNPSIMASGIARGRVRTTTTTTELPNKLGGHTASVYRVLL